MRRSILGGVGGLVLVLVLILVGGSTPQIYAFPPDEGDTRGVDYFERQIRPLLAAHCYPCHSRESQKSKGGLLLDSPGGLLKGGDSGELFVPGEPDASLLIEAVRYQEEALKMPPDGKRLTEAQVADLETWVRMGGPLPRANVQEDSIRANSRTHWAFQPVKRFDVPAVRDRTWVQSPIDAFILARLEAAGMQPADPADKRTLLRRASYDLIGLPPTPEEVAAFVTDESPAAFATVVDRLLASPHYGERWGRHWLDVARFATSDSPYAFTYRDYVVRAFNNDLPYDEFLVQQMAADQLDLGEDKRPLAALAFLACGRSFMNRHDTIDDRIDVVTRGTMGLSVSCARCHDHKYDPIPTRDYYSLHGVFGSTVAPPEMPLLGIEPDPEEFAEYSRRRQPLQAKLEDFLRKQEAAVLKQHRRQTADCLLLSREPTRLAELITEEFGLSDRKILQVGAKRWLEALKKMDPEVDPIFAPWFAFAALPTSEFAEKSEPLSARIAANSLAHPLNALVAGAFAGEPPASLKEVAERYGKLFQDADRRWQEAKAEAVLDTDPAPLPDAEQEALRQVFHGKDSPGNLPSEMMRPLFPTTALMQLGPLGANLSRLEASHPGAPLRAMALVDGPRPANSRVFIRGNSDRLGDEVPRQFLTILSGETRQPFTHGSGRLDLARAIASPANPLTARVLVNRVWLHHFGAGLVATPDDFGLRSDPPSHPELLDYLAREFVEHDWSLKNLHRVMMLSSVYQQKSDNAWRYETRDPDNRLLSKMNRRRLDFEAMRDTLLFVAGNLDPTVGGRPVDLLAQREGSFARRRTIYGATDRNDLPGLYRVFDFANPDLTTAQRDTTTVPQQSLFFLNSPFVMEQASKLTESPSVQGLDCEAEQIRALFQRVYQRDPSENEHQWGLRFLRGVSASEDADETIPKQPLTPMERYAQVLMMSNELMFVD